jgi:Uma2 family endonuclease
MATDTLPNDSLLVLPADLRPNVDHLVTEDDTPVDNIFSEKQQRLLTEPLYSSWARSQSRPFVATANVGLFYAIRQPPFVPDAMLSVDVELPADARPKERRSYFVWVYGKAPDVVIEVVSNTEGGEDTVKLAGYARAGVRYYVIFDPFRLLSDEVLRAYRLEGLKFRRMEGAVLFPDVELGLQLWDGRYEEWETTWLRWVDAAGQLVLTGNELAESRLEQAESERRRADRLAEQLRRLGVDPQHP